MEISQVIALVALVVAVLGLLGNTRKDTRADAAVLATIETKLNTLISGVDDIRVENKSLQKELYKHGEKIVELDARVKVLENKKHTEEE